MTDQERMQDFISRWNDLTADEKAEAQAIAVEQAAKARMDQMVNRALGLEYDWATGEWK